MGPQVLYMIYSRRVHPCCSNTRYKFWQILLARFVTISDWWTLNLVEIQLTSFISALITYSLSGVSVHSYMLVIAPDLSGYSPLL